MVSVPVLKPHCLSTLLAQVNKKGIFEVMDMIKNNTCIKFRNKASCFDCELPNRQFVLFTAERNRYNLHVSPKNYSYFHNFISRYDAVLYICLYVRIYIYI